ncbi:MAG: DUF6125 family protein [Desulfosalsimonadaceae bacterium]
MFDIEKWNKEETYAVMLELLYSFNYMWFLMEGWVKTHCPEKADSEAFRVLSEQFGAYQAKRLEKTITEPVEGIDRLTAFLRHSHWFAFEDITLEKLSDTRLRMRTSGCTAQKAAKKWGMDHYACGDGGFRLRKGFFTRVDPSATVTRVFTPPDEKPADIPDDISCEWIIAID